MEEDFILGLRNSAIGTLVERTTRFTMLLHLPPIAGHGLAPREKNGPALAGHGAEAVRDAISRTVTNLPEQLRRSLTWDQGAEMAKHARSRIETGLQIYFSDPRSPWQRGTNENTNGLLRQYFPKDQSQCSQLGRSGGHRSSAQRQTAQDTGMENTCGGSRRNTTIRSCGRSGFNAGAGTAQLRTCFITIMSDSAYFIVIAALATSYTAALLAAVAMQAL